MRKIVAKLVIGAAIAVIGMFGVDSSLESKIIDNYPVKSRTEVWEATPGDRLLGVMVDNKLAGRGGYASDGGDELARRS